MHDARTKGDANQRHRAVPLDAVGEGVGEDGAGLVGAVAGEGEGVVDCRGGGGDEVGGPEGGGEGGEDGVPEEVEF